MAVSHTPSPQSYSTWQVSLQPSRFVVFPSSLCSHASQIPLPQVGEPSSSMQAALQPSPSTL
ncbi:MAG: hypothetical protein ABI333_09610, partial [bacterium]